VPAGAPVAVLTRLLIGPARAGYRLMADNRRRLGRLVTPAMRDHATAAIEHHRRRVLGT
jgi:hypothetical protein